MIVESSVYSVVACISDQHSARTGQISRDMHNRV